MRTWRGIVVCKWTLALRPLFEAMAEPEASPPAQPEQLRPPKWRKALGRKVYLVGWFPTRAASPRSATAHEQACQCKSSQLRRTRNFRGLQPGTNRIRKTNLYQTIQNITLRNQIPWGNTLNSVAKPSTRIKAPPPSLSHANEDTRPGSIIPVGSSANSFRSPRQTAAPCFPPHRRIRRSSPRRSPNPPAPCRRPCSWGTRLGLESSPCSPRR